MGDQQRQQAAGCQYGHSLRILIDKYESFASKDEDLRYDEERSNSGVVSLSASKHELNFGNSDLNTSSKVYCWKNLILVRMTLNCFLYLFISMQLCIYVDLFTH
jgi:hypothetical protein